MQPHLPIYRIALLFLFVLSVGCKGLFTDLDDDASDTGDTSTDLLNCADLREIETYYEEARFAPTDNLSLFAREPLSMEFNLRLGLDPGLTGTSSNRGLEVVSREDEGCVSISEASCTETSDLTERTYRNTHGPIADPGHYCIYFTTRDATRTYHHAYYKVELTERTNGQAPECSELPGCTATSSTCCGAVQCSESNPSC